MAKTVTLHLATRRSPPEFPAPPVAFIHANPTSANSTHDRLVSHECVSMAELKDALAGLRQDLDEIEREGRAFFKS